MDILIKGMEMPETGCYILSVDNTGKDKTIFTIAEHTHSGKIILRYVGEAVLVPPHGDLIDRAKLWVEINKICDRRDAGIITDLACLQQILSAVRHAPTIIEAEEV